MFHTHIAILFVSYESFKSMKLSIDEKISMKQFTCENFNKVTMRSNVVNKVGNEIQGFQCTITINPRVESAFPISMLIRSLIYFKT